MKKTTTHIEGLYVIENKVQKDIRGQFMEFWNDNKFQKENLNINFSQDNISTSKKNVLRGLHFQYQPYGQIKYVSVLKGAVLDVAVDLRQDSKTYGQHFQIKLSEENNYGLLIPSGFAHGFLALEKENIFAYKCKGKYYQKYEETINWNDPELDINWGIKKPILSKKDSNGKSFQEYRGSDLLKR